MNVANVENCEELFELSGWGTDLERYVMENVPAYDLGMLLRKLPPYYVIYRGIEKCHVGIIAGRNFVSNRGIEEIEADTPEDAACLLAIELIKQGIIQPREGLK